MQTRNMLLWRPSIIVSILLFSRVTVALTFNWQPVTSPYEETTLQTTLTPDWPANTGQKFIPLLMDELAERLWNDAVLEFEHLPGQRMPHDICSPDFLVAALYVPEKHKVYASSVPKASFKRKLDDPQNTHLAEVKWCHAEHGAYDLAVKDGANPGRRSYMGIYGKAQPKIWTTPCADDYRTGKENCQDFLKKHGIGYKGNESTPSPSPPPSSAPKSPSASRPVSKEPGLDTSPSTRKSNRNPSPGPSSSKRNSKHQRREILDLGELFDAILEVRDMVDDDDEIW